MSTEHATGPDLPASGPPLLHRVRDFLLGHPAHPDAPEGPPSEPVPDPQV